MCLFIKKKIIVRSLEFIINAEVSLYPCVYQVTIIVIDLEKGPYTCRDASNFATLMWYNFVGS